jgi:hypothetical protein
MWGGPSTIQQKACYDGMENWLEIHDMQWLEIHDALCIQLTTLLCK